MDRSCSTRGMNETGCDGTDFIQNRIQWRSLRNAVLNFRAS